MQNSNIRVRFAPSPTGHLHIGSLRTALFNYFFAKHHGGKYLVRIEDTDVARSKKEYVDSIMDSLEWSNLKPDEPLVFQMSRLAEHKQMAEKLLFEEKAYRCFCSVTNTEKVQKQLESGIASQYPGTCRDFKPTAEDLKKPHAIRFKLEKKTEKFTFHDLIRGELSFDYDQFDDFVIVRQDGTPTYNFVVVIDDLFMKITHVIRGEDHIYNTPKQIFLYQALNESIPAFAHLPLILSPNGGRLSKRHGAVSVVEYKKQGFLAHALNNYLIRLGWSHKDQEIFTHDEIIRLFSLEHVGKSGATFDQKKLEWVNNNYIKASSANDLLNLFNDISPEETEQLKKLWSQNLTTLIDLYKERVSTIKDLMETLVKLASDPTIDPESLGLELSSENKKILETVSNELSSLTEWNKENITAAGKKTLASCSIKMPLLGIPLRIAITGEKSSPGIFNLLSLLTKETVLNRIKLFISHC